MEVVKTVLKIIVGLAVGVLIGLVIGGGIGLLLKAIFLAGLPIYEFYPVLIL